MFTIDKPLSFVMIIFKKNSMTERENVFRNIELQ